MKIVVIGGGYAGMMAALRLGRRHGITVISAEDRFTQRIRLHEFVAGRPSVTVPLAELTRGTGIEVVTAWVEGIDLAAKRVRTADGREFGYDTLVYALGSHTDLSLPGTAEHTYTVERAAELRERLADGAKKVVVVGGGLTGIELAAELAESHPGRRIELVAGTVAGAGLSARGRARVERTLTRLGVTIHTGTRVTSVEEGVLHTDRGDISADVIAWAGSFAVPGLAAAAGLAVDDRGRARVDGTMRSLSHPDVYVVGDAAAVEIPGAGVSRMSCAVGMPIAAHAADAINARADGRTPAEFRFRYFIQCISLGRRDGVIQWVKPDDSPAKLVITGRLGAWVKEQVCRSTVTWLRMERRRPGSYLWPKGPAPVRRSADEGRAVADLPAADLTRS
ncbi:pyridine nucleotide-disulfide oxidoreductase [Spongiactinospora rosea]|uniref:Pyridine nucleotide-disulfide oxidoreductase n=1 Tax=Spongiactinospora rosea TaxID=2248750 RepID=A0A366LPB6_9ACTN|nr:FAD-dependent oxidoreductase [Spongiactinospora rosea]RBQ15490.1 pyridine nucleotide-disulfide oxidoreductase [Spongiactinospora rosea]